MTDPNTPAHGGGHPASPAQVAEADGSLDAPSPRASMERQPRRRRRRSTCGGAAARDIARSRA
ncbi:hypothetical protein [Frondihabitans sp. PAMC 28766]|uniref:hypothetical protein n=1 Tax=Frondihabitans sp. PAMC 28766 TaxID=1795630 RepID=UPI00138EEC11|nr:hypothetical protein [Frondihabitans sp. PAMC 28766]